MRLIWPTDLRINEYIFLKRRKTVHYRGDECASKHGLNEADKMVVKFIFNVFLKTIEVWKSQDDEFFRMGHCPGMYFPENSLNSMGKLAGIR